MRKIFSTYIVVFLFPIFLLISHIYLIVKEQHESMVTVELLEKSFSELLRRYQYLPKVLSEDPRIKAVLEGGLSSDELSKTFKSIKESSGVGVVYLLDKHGTGISSSNYDLPTSFIGNNYGFRPYFNNAKALGVGSYFAVGVTTGIPGYFLAARVQDNEETLGVVVIKIEPDQMNLSWHKLNETIFIINEDGIILLCNKVEWLYKSIWDLDEKQHVMIEKQKQFAKFSVKKIVSNEIFIKKWSIKLWSMLNKFYLINSKPLGVSNFFSSSHWEIYSASPYILVVKKTIYSGIFIFLALLSLYLFLRHRAIVQYARLMEEKSNEKRRTELQSIIDSTQVALVIADKQRYITSANPIFSKMVGKHQGQIVGGSLDKFIPSMKSNDLWGLTSAGFIETELENNIPIMYSCNIATLDDAVCIITIVDITKRKKAEKALRYLNGNLENLVKQRTEELHSVQHELVRQEKMIVLGRMAAAIVHELSQPVASFASALASTKIKLSRDDNEGANISVSNMIPLCENMKEVIVQLRAFGHSGTSEQSHVCINDLLVKIAHDIHKEDILELNIITDNICIVNCNLIMLQIAINNIIKNALDAVKDKDDPKVQVTLVCDDQVVINIKDNAGKMNSDIVEHLFEPFFTTKLIGDGLGIGLAISRNAVIDIGGDISVSYDKCHTEFKLSLPLAVEH